MPLYMDVHNDVGELTPEDVAEAHERDLEHQDEHGVEFLRYWADPEAGKIFCLSEAPDADAAQAVHEQAGHPADEIYEVVEGG